MEIKVIDADITKIAHNFDCIVNAANESLLGGGGVDGMIHRAAGPQLLDECRKLNGCEPGEVKLTKGYNLGCKYILHAVGPRYYSSSNPEKLLKQVYYRCLRLADSMKCKSIAFPSISTGAFRFPIDKAAEIFAHVALRFESDYLDEVVMCTYHSDTNFEKYSNAICLDKPRLLQETFNDLLNYTKSLDLLLKPFLHMYSQKIITSEQFLERMKLFNLTNYFKSFDNSFDFEVKSMIDKINEHLKPIDFEDYRPDGCDVWELWEGGYGYIDDEFVNMGRMNNSILEFFYGYPPFCFGHIGGLYFWHVFVTDRFYDFEKYRRFRIENPIMRPFNKDEN